ncbi:MAG: enoyl-CoA hydratase [Gammaproteobacteria bacterium]|nr:enoyl-CoA hydratase [Gammaproteobacteria bacterium]MBT5205168.1 enoyl-CoA hydratase [Gammaproteobacteria bacterium]MBT5602926.1 enoyl-CoA hydratase [Gammaproteobacteria bacterium]
MTDKLLFEMKATTALVTINNPAANTWDADNLAALESLIDNLNKDPNCYSLVITGQGDKFFSAGADLNLFADGDADHARVMADRFHSAFQALTRFSGVSIAAINGYAMGGGLECAMACDIRIAEQQAVMALPEATVGLLPCGLGTQHLPWLVGEGWAKRMILCGERVNADTALSIGLIEEVVEKGQSLDRSLALAAMTGNQSPTSVSACKRLIMAARTGHMETALANERDEFVALFSTADQEEGVNAFLGKRKPIWKNA